MSEDIWPGPATGSTSGDEQHVVAVARVPGLHAILNENTATELPVIRPATTQPADPLGRQPR